VPVPQLASPLQVLEARFALELAASA